MSDSSDGLIRALSVPPLRTSSYDNGMSEKVDVWQVMRTCLAGMEHMSVRHGRMPWGIGSTLKELGHPQLESTEAISTLAALLEVASSTW